MNKKLFTDPNQEVETWKDSIYFKHKKLTGEELTKHFTQISKEIIKKYKIKIARLSKNTPIFFNSQYAGKHL